MKLYKLITRNQKDNIFISFNKNREKKDQT
jgi:hypothetical protein